MFEILRKKKKQNELNKIAVQKVSKAINIRDFLYLDFERVKSIFAQLEEGLVTGREKVGGTAREVTGKGEGGVPTFIKLAAEGKFIWENEEHETKTLHDYMYQHVENKILDSDMVTNIDNSTVTLDKLKGDELRSEIDKKPFLLISGRISLYDYDYLKGILENFNELSKFIARCSISKLTGQLTREKRKQIEKEALSKNQRPDWEIKGWKMFFEIFYKERCMLTLYTNENVPEVSFTGHLIKAFIRDGLESVMFRYGTSPQIPWNIFAQIAYIPLGGKSVQSSMTPQKTQSLDEALRGLFGAMQGIEKLANDITYPAISIIPIAIYK